MGAVKKKVASADRGVKDETMVTAVVNESEALDMVKAIEKDVAAAFDGGLIEVVENDKQYVAAAELLVAVVSRRKYVEEQRGLFLEDVKRMVTRVESWFKPALEKITVVEDHFRERVVNYAKAFDVAAQNMRERAVVIAEKDEDKAVRLLTEANTLTAPKVAGISFSTPTSVVLTNEALLPPAYKKMVPDLDAIEAALKQGKKVKGAALVVGKTVRVTPSHAKKES